MYPIEEHLEALYAMARNLCGNPTEAEDLTHDTMLQAIIRLREGADVANMKAWLIGIMKNLHAMNLRKKYRMPTVSIHSMEFASKSNEIDAMIEKEAKSEEAVRLRREIAYLSGVYRDIIVNYYYHGKTVGQIAESLAIPEGTVKSRLFSGRKKLKKGYTKMAVQQSKLNLNTQYMQPKELRILNSGTLNAPFRRIMNNLMLQNILLAAYDAPLTVEEIARRLGIPAAYIEDAAEQMVRTDMLKQEGTKLSAAIPVYSMEDRYRLLEGEKVFADLNYRTAADILTGHLTALRKTDYYAKHGERAQKKLEFFFVMDALEDGIFRADPDNTTTESTMHEDGTCFDAWGIVVNDKGVSKEISDTVSEADRKYIFAGHRTSWYKENRFHEYDTVFDCFKYYYITELLCRIHTGEEITNEKDLECIPDLLERGILAREDGVLKVDIPVLTGAEYGEYTLLKDSCADTFAEKIRDQMADYLASRRLKVPDHLQVSRSWLLTRPNTEHLQMLFVHKMAEEGLLFAGIDYPCPAKVLELK